MWQINMYFFYTKEYKFVLRFFIISCVQQHLNTPHYKPSTISQTQQQFILEQSMHQGQMPVNLQEDPSRVLWAEIEHIISDHSCVLKSIRRII